MKPRKNIRMWFLLILLLFNSFQVSSQTPSSHLNTTQQTSSNDDWVPYGTAYVWSSDFSDVQGIRTQLAYLHSLGVRTVIQMHSANRPLATRRLFLDEALAYNIRVIVRISGTQDPPWGWNGTNFDWTPLINFLDGGEIADHPALLAIYGMHIPWDDFNNGNGLIGEVRRFYTEFHAIAPNIPLFHDLVWLEPQFAEFTDGMCDLCEISSMPHTWLNNTPVNNDIHVTEKIVRYTSAIHQADPDAQVWIEAQTFERVPNFRMPTASDMIWHANILADHVDFDGLIWYPYLHTYSHQLGDDDMGAQQQAVHTVYMTHYWTDYTFTDFNYLPYISQ